MELQMYLEFNLATRIKLCWWPELSGQWFPAGLLRDARIHSQIFKTQNIFATSFGSGITAKKTSAANSAFLSLHWRKCKAKTVSNRGGSDLAWKHEETTNTTDLAHSWGATWPEPAPSPWHSTEPWGWTGTGARGRTPHLGVSPPPTPLAVRDARDHCSGPGPTTDQQNWVIFRLIYTKTKPLQRYNCRGIKIRCLIMSGSRYELYLQHFLSALLAKHRVSRGDFTTCATLSSSCVLQADRALSHP